MDERHLLVTVSEQESALYGVQFVGHFFSNKQGLKITLFFTAPKPPALWEGERTHESVRDSERQSKEYERQGQKALAAAKKALRTLGFGEEQIATKLVVRQQSKAMDIIREGEQGLYDAVVLGRRGLSWLEQVFDESTSKDLLEKELTFPLWLCRRPDLGRKNILLCMDGSEAAYRMADHVGYMLARDKDHEITL
jgi:nucleotide-binding universal stress UspA family protein